MYACIVCVTTAIIYINNEKHTFLLKPVHCKAELDLKFAFGVLYW
jgi:hypothetical protein